MPTSSHLERLYATGFGLFTDLYQLTMAQAYWKKGWYDRRGVFQLYYRSPPFGGHYVVAAGLDLAIDLIRNYTFSEEAARYLGNLRGAAGQSLFEIGFLNYLQRLRMQCDVDAVPEGTVVFPNEPLLRVEGPLPQAQMLETALLSVINFSSLIATKAARVARAAKGDSVLEFGFRRAQGLDGAITATRAAFIGGCNATSNVIAGQLYNIPVKGTHAHSWIMCFEEEIEAFRAYAEAFPHDSVFLVDTYDTLQGVRNAIQVGRELREQGCEMAGIRLDSGDLAELSRKARHMLDEAGFPDAAIVASNSLDEYAIEELKSQGAPIVVWGVGTKLSTAYDQPALGGVYKLSAVQGPGSRWNYKAKLSEQAVKSSNPGALQIRRYWDAEGLPAGDALYNAHTEGSADLPPVRSLRDGALLNLKTSQHTDLLQPVFRNGELVLQRPSLHAVQEYARQQQLPFAKLQMNPTYPVGLTSDLYTLKQSIQTELG